MLDKEAIYFLQISGFTDREIKKLDDAVTPNGEPQPTIDMDNPAWRAAGLTRMDYRGELKAQWAKDHKGKKPTRRTIDNLIDSSYRGNDTPFDYLRDIYAKGLAQTSVDLRKAKPSDFVAAGRVDIARTSAKQQIKKDAQKTLRRR